MLVNEFVGDDDCVVQNELKRLARVLNGTRLACLFLPTVFSPPSA